MKEVKDRKLTCISHLDIVGPPNPFLDISEGSLETGEWCIERCIVVPLTMNLNKFRCLGRLVRIIKEYKTYRVIDIFHFPRF